MHMFACMLALWIDNNLLLTDGKGQKYFQKSHRHTQ